LKSLVKQVYGSKMEREAASPDWLKERNNDPYGTDRRHPFWSTVTTEDLGSNGSKRIFEKDGTWYGYHSRQNYWMTFTDEEDARQWGNSEQDLDMWASLNVEASRLIREAGDNPFEKKEEPSDASGDGSTPHSEGNPNDPPKDEKPAEEQGDLDPTKMQPASPITLSYTLTGAAPGEPGEVPATFESFDGTTAFFTYDKGDGQQSRFGVTNQGGKWVDAAGTEFTFKGDPAAAQQSQQPNPAAPNPAQQQPAQPAQQGTNQMAASRGRLPFVKQADLSSAKTVEDVLAECPKISGVSSGDGFWEGDGDSFADALSDAGWTYAWSNANYHFAMHPPGGGEGLRYVEGDIYRGIGMQSTGVRTANLLDSARKVMETRGFVSIDDSGNIVDTEWEGDEIAGDSGMVLDLTTANLITTLVPALNAENQAKILAMPAAQAVDTLWKLYGRVKASKQAGLRDYDYSDTHYSNACATGESNFHCDGVIPEDEKYGGMSCDCPCHESWDGEQDLGEFHQELDLQTAGSKTAIVPSQDGCPQHPGLSFTQDATLHSLHEHRSAWDNGDAGRPLSIAEMQEIDRLERLVASQPTAAKTALAGDKVCPECGGKGYWTHYVGPKHGDEEPCPRCGGIGYVRDPNASPARTEGAAGTTPHQGEWPNFPECPSCGHIFRDAMVPEGQIGSSRWMTCPSCGGQVSLPKAGTKTAADTCPGSGRLANSASGASWSGSGNAYCSSCGSTVEVTDDGKAKDHAGTTASKTAMPNPVDLGVVVGDIFYSSWGYDQTNIDFYEVVGLTGASVKVRQVASKFVNEPGDHPSQDRVVADKGNYIGEVMTKRIQAGYQGRPSFNVASYASAWLWDGTPKYQTGQGWGH
jgi:hypothetical protein